MVNFADAAMKLKGWKYGVRLRFYDNKTKPLLAQKNLFLIDHLQL